MLAVGAAVLLGGYTLLFWGNRVRTGSPLGVADVLIPGHYQKGPLPPVVAGAPGTGAKAGPSTPETNTNAGGGVTVR